MTTPTAADREKAEKIASTFPFISRYTSGPALIGAIAQAIADERERCFPGGAVPVRCFGCGKLYSELDDFFIPIEHWNRISPRPGTEKEGGGGILCAVCASERLKALGVERVPFRWTSGPFCEGG